jgi:hypothetical protein
VRALSSFSAALRTRCDGVRMSDFRYCRAGLASA